MKASIIGGGIAGLAAAITLRRIGWDVSINERARQFSEVGLGFIILPNGLDALDHLGAGAYVRKNGSMMNRVTVRDNKGQLLRDDSLENSLAIKRSDCIDALRALVPAELIHTNAEFSHFEYNDEGYAIAAHFSNGRRETADIFIGADGSNSIIRKLLFPSHIIEPTFIKELVGIADMPEMVQQIGSRLLKTQSLEKGLSIGLLPCNDRQLVWYIQFDCTRHDLTDLSGEKKKWFAKELLEGWPDPIQYVLEHADFSRSYMWFTKDMDLLPAFHQRNIILAGDAAHLVLPFTSQGVNSALQDAIVLAGLLKDLQSTRSLDEALATYYQVRKPILEEYHEFGKMMAKRFLDPGSFDDQVPIPLAK